MRVLTRSRTHGLREEARSRLSHGAEIAGDKLSDAEHRLVGLGKEKLNDAESRIRKVTRDQLSEAESHLHGILPGRRRRRSSKVRKVIFLTLILSGALALTFAAMKKLQARPHSASWQPSWDKNVSPVNPGSPDSATAEPKLSSGQSERVASRRESVDGANSIRGAGSQAASVTSEQLLPDLAVAAKLDSLLGKKVVDMSGAAIGEVERVYYRARSWQPEWAAVSTGLADKEHVAVPLTDAIIDKEVRLAYPKELAEGAPELDSPIFGEDLEMLAYEHYGLRRELADDIVPTTAGLETKLIAWPRYAETTSS